jgi:outer membrane scaffolding protein for murein synthesis (MipA/OmpV family)
MNSLLASREFWTMVVGTLVSIVVAIVPQLEGSKAEIISAVMVLVGVIITNFGVEKAAAANRAGNTKIERLSVASSATSLGVKAPQ